MAAVPLVLPGYRLDGVHAAPSDLVVSASSRARSGACPACGHNSRRVHGRYTRSPADLPVSDRAVGLRLPARLGGAGSDGSAARTRRAHGGRLPSRSQGPGQIGALTYGRSLETSRSAGRGTPGRQPGVRTSLEYCLGPRSQPLLRGRRPDAKSSRGGQRGWAGSSIGEGMRRFWTATVPRCTNLPTT